VLIAGFPAKLGTNCWVVAPGPREQCVIIDPGIDAVSPLEDLLAEHHLNPVAVLLTHGHYDHTWSVVPVCGARGIPAYIHPADRSQLTSPLEAVGRPPGVMLFGRRDFTEPDDVRQLVDGQSIALGPVSLWVTQAAGHTPGSVTFTTEADNGSPDQLFSGDLLFAGSVGRTDLPGGDYEQLLASLARVCLPLSDDTVLRPGHGATSTIGRERQSNRYMQEAARFAAYEPVNSRPGIMP
jgi:glyoxylase-like metal-dependent hydrolase (beta-lactamase superfamily II)